MWQLALVVVLVLVVFSGIILIADIYFYPVCLRCRNNLCSKRKLFSKTAVCNKHGEFTL